MTAAGERSKLKGGPGNPEVCVLSARRQPGASHSRGVSVRLRLYSCQRSNHNRRFFQAMTPTDIADLKRAQKAHRRSVAESMRDWRMEAVQQRSFAPAAPTLMREGVAAPRERRDHGSSKTTRGSPDDDPGEPEPPAAGGFRLNFVDRAPLLWRIRAARCRLHELVEGVTA
jgi:hypothetical protein